MIDPAAPDFSATPFSTSRPSFAYRPGSVGPAPEVAIVTPFYNTGEIFHETAHSVFGQSFQQWEWLIVNDGSARPEALAVLAMYRERDPRIRVIDLPHNRGLSAARNTGYREARASYIVQLDSDDLIEPTAIEKWIWFLTSFTEYSFVKGYSVGFGAHNYLWQKGFHSRDMFLQENCVDPTSMVRRTVHQAVGGFDETNREGLEDWDFWLRCAHSGYWGGTVPEHLDWYRRRASHNDTWSNWDGGKRQELFRAGLRRRYASLWERGVPKIELRWHMANDPVPDELPFENPLQKSASRLLMILPWMAMGGADKFNLDLLRQMARRGWEVTIATTLKGDHSWLPQFARYTPDIFILSHFLRLTDYPRFLRYLIESRQPDVVLISNSELGYQLLPYLRAHFPGVAFMDFSHIEEEYWKNGGYPRMGVETQELLDQNIVASEHLRRWMIERGGDGDRIQVCHINVDPDQWRPDTELRRRTRGELDCSDDVVLILYAARLCEQKQPMVFGKTVRRLRELGLDFAAVVAGDGPDLERLRAYVRRHHLGRWVRMLGRVSNERVRELMGASDILFLPSMWEGIALAIYEAMASGLTVVGADVGGQRELVTPDCGILVARGDPDGEAQQYALALAEIIRNPERRMAMGQRARERVQEHFRLDGMGERMEGIFRQAVRIHDHRPRLAPQIGLGRMFAAQAIEYARLSQAADQLWFQWNKFNQQTSPMVRLSFREYLFLALRSGLLPLYQGMLARGWTWVVPLKTFLKKWTLGSSE